MAEASSSRGTASLLFVGRTGVGKSSLINSIAGKEIAKEYDYCDLGTPCVVMYITEYEGRTLRLWDSPGLSDCAGESEKYLESIKKVLGQINVVVYCINMSESRVTDQDKSCIVKYSNKFGSSFWSRSVLVFTFANCVNPPANFNNKYLRIKQKYKELLSEAGVAKHVIDDIPSVPAGYHPWKPQGKLPNYSGYWISTFWVSCLERVKKSVSTSSDLVLQSRPNRESRPNPNSRPSIMIMQRSQTIHHQGTSSTQSITSIRMLSSASNDLSDFLASSLQRLSIQLEQRQQWRRQLPAIDFPASSGTSLCTYNRYRDQYIEQEWFICYTCWGPGNVVFGCCKSCASSCHSGHKLQRRYSKFYCDCGHNKHQQAVCTYNQTKQEHYTQPFYNCYTCFSSTNFGVCYQCSINCHSGPNHFVVFIGVIDSFCDCGLEDCKIYCKIAEPN